MVIKSPRGLSVTTPHVLFVAGLSKSDACVSPVPLDGGVDGDEKRRGDGLILDMTASSPTTTMMLRNDKCCPLSPLKSPTKSPSSNPDEVRRWSRSPMQPNRWQLGRPSAFSADENESEQHEEDDDADDAKEEAVVDKEEESAPLPYAPEISSSRNPTMQPPSKELMDLIVAKSWHRAARLCQSNPALAAYRGTESGGGGAVGGDQQVLLGPTCLFVACQNRPPVRVVQALLRAYPDAALIECSLEDPTLVDNTGNSDANKGTEVGAVNSTTSNKWLPLHMACRCNASLSVLQALLEHHPEASLAGTSSYPVNELYDHRDTFESSFAPTNYRSVFWQKVGALLQAMASSSSQHSTMVHVAALSGIPDVLDYALSDYAATMYANASTSASYPLNAIGQTPLHLALINTAAAAATTSASSSSQSPHSTLSSNVLTIVTKLLSHDASLTNVPDPQQRYPLHMALTLHSHPHVHAVALKILQAEPSSVTLADPRTHLYPFQMAASLTTVAADVVDVEVVYRILRTHPSALGRCRSDAPRRSSNGVRSGPSNDRMGKDSRMAESTAPTKPTAVDFELSRVKVPARVEPKPSKPSPHARVKNATAQVTKTECAAGIGTLKDAERSLIPEESTRMPQSCSSSPATSIPAPVSMSSPPASPSTHRASAAAANKSISLSDFFQSPRTKKKHAPCLKPESSTVALVLDEDEAYSADDTCLFSGAVDEDRDHQSLDGSGSVSVPPAAEADPIVRSINGMCSGALLLLTTMFHRSATDLLSSSSHHSKKR